MKMYSVKLFSFVYVLLFGAFFFSSCQKEFTIETGTAKGSLKSDTTGDCMPVLLNGSYKKDTLLNSTNYADIQVNITQAGTYSIKSDTLNGYSFSATGAAVTGINTIRLLGTGRPFAGGLNIFKIKFDSSICELNVIVTGSGGVGGTALFTLGTTPGTTLTSCAGAVISGIYTQGVPANSSNTATVNVNVSQVGTYTITTGAVNGVTFSGSGSFTTLGANTIILTANGMPTAAIPAAYPLSSGTNNCSFNITYAAGVPPASYTIDCTGATVAGNYQAGVPVTSANTVTISATSIGAGSYSISTNTVNGISFTGNGTFSGAATQPIVLTAMGNSAGPTATGPFPFIATAATGGSTCTFSVTFTGGTPPPPSTDSIVASIDGVYTTFKFRDSAQRAITNGYDAIGLTGDNNVAGDETFGVGVGTLATLGPGTYNINQFPTAVIGAQYSSATFEYWAQTDPFGPPQIPGFTITILTLTATKVTGTFSGRIFENQGAGPGFKTVQNGRFSVTIYP